MDQKWNQYCAQKDERSDSKWAYSEGLKLMENEPYKCEALDGQNGPIRGLAGR